MASKKAQPKNPSKATGILELLELPTDRLLLALAFKLRREAINEPTVERIDRAAAVRALLPPSQRFPLPARRYDSRRRAARAVVRDIASSPILRLVDDARYTLAAELALGVLARRMPEHSFHELRAMPRDAGKAAAVRLAEELEAITFDRRRALTAKQIAIEALVVTGMQRRPAGYIFRGVSA
ncbi:MAG: hypothetical protein OZ921_15285 [Sorangiineae bacterium]|nr:hypothetical protein [Polyangiaceae bacterium]MEB2323874.1 hypothetical protein [Sorangiineae bacterium]